MTIRNLTPHPIRIYHPDTPDQLDDPTIGFVLAIPPEEPPARVGSTEVDLGGPIEFEGRAIPTVLITYRCVDDLPAPTPGVQLIVSPAVAVAAHGRSDLLVPYAEVRNEIGTVVGCRRLASPC